MSEDTHDAPTGAPVSHPPISTYGVPDVMCDPTSYVQCLLVALARIRNMATASHVPAQHRLDWCANEAIFALDRIAPSTHAPSGASDAPWRSEHDAKLAAMEVALKVAHDELATCRTALESCRPILKARLIDADLRGYGDTGALAALDLVADALAPAPLATPDVPSTPPP